MRQRGRLSGRHLSSSIASATEGRGEGRQHRVCERREIFCLLLALDCGDGWMLTLFNAGRIKPLLQPGLGLNCSFVFLDAHRGVEQTESRMWYCLRAIYEHLSAGITGALR